MSVAGIDFGSQTNVIALARRKGIDVVMNEESKRETPSLVNFGDKYVRFFKHFYYSRFCGKMMIEKIERGDFWKSQKSSQSALNKREESMRVCVYEL